MPLPPQSFIVTGGASGLGAAVVRQLAQDGASVLIADLDATAGQALADRLGSRVRFARCDVTQAQDAQSAVDAASALAPLRGLINCAGIAPAEKILGKHGPHRLETFSQTLSVNLIGSFNMLRLAAQAMSVLPAGADGQRGLIINTASIAAFEGQIGQAAYAAAKGGLVAMTLPIARDLAPWGIRCVTIAPGVFATPMVQAMAPEVQARLAGQAPFPARAGEPHEFAQLVKAIIDNPMINGSTIRLDGALRLGPQ
ncbi:MAG TPA: SDR family NAD(P)-dependent oxidoreductase [Burkholderiaceae bacterium]|nr:SDR family NAD(P)-dependent oxidoreductase [Burkholderiaceae bacterium]